MLNRAITRACCSNTLEEGGKHGERFGSPERRAPRRISIATTSWGLCDRLLLSGVQWKPGKLNGDIMNYIKHNKAGTKIAKKAFNGVLGLRHGVGAAGRLALENKLGKGIGKSARLRNKAFG